MATWLICLVTLLLSNALTLARPSPEQRSLERRAGGLSGPEAAAMECVEKAVAALLLNPRRLMLEHSVLSFVIGDCERAHGVEPEISPKAWADLQKLSNQVGQIQESDQERTFPSEPKDRAAARRRVLDRGMERLFGTMPTRDPRTGKIIDDPYVSPELERQRRFPLAQEYGDGEWTRSEDAAAQCLKMEVEELVHNYDWPSYGGGLADLGQVIRKCEQRHGHRPELNDVLRDRLQVGSNKHARFEEQRIQPRGGKNPRTVEQIREGVEKGCKERYGVPPQRDPQTGRVIDEAQPSQFTSGGIAGRRVASMPSKMSLSNVNMRTARDQVARLTDTVKIGGSNLKSSVGTSLGKPNEWMPRIAASIRTFKPSKPGLAPAL
ncbi:MAG: hypothetical protein M1823_005956 [Watsoniomyces obsoletus]|nr:MAG: hypothetical protein M1823_005956 [Watsoniomyces obsoletus]